MKRGSRLVVVVATRRGAALAARIAASLPDAEPHIAQRWSTLLPDAVALRAPLSRALPEVFCDPTVGGLIVVLALGATVRLLAPFLTDKHRDPAVVVVDDAGKFVVSVLAGHRGGANALAHRVADVLDAIPVITTASDSQGVLAVDLLGVGEGWHTDASEETLRRVASAVVNDDPVGVYQDAGDRTWLERERLSAGTRLLPSLDPEFLAGLSALLVITDTDPILPPQLPCVVYHPPTLAIGVGCSTGAGEEDIACAVQAALREGGLAGESLAAIGTIDRRAGEPGLVQYADRMHLPIRSFSAAELAAVPDLPTPSDVVQRAVGTPGVCEPAALLLSGARCVTVAKVRTERATAAIARVPSPTGVGGLSAEGAVVGALP